MTRNNRPGSTAELKRAETAGSRNSRLSRSSRGSGGSLSSSVRGLGTVKRKMDTLMTHYINSRDGETIEKYQNPYDAIFGRKIANKIKDKTQSYIEKINFNEFREKV